jgi:hypothetical protein
MPSANSSVAGYLSPSAEPLDDDDLEDIMHDAIVGLTGITGDLVRPRWQPEPAQQPAFSANWVAFGITRWTPDTYSYQRQDDDFNHVVERDILLYVLHSFYGPKSMGLCNRFRDSFDIAQNRDQLVAAGIELVEVQEALNIPALLKAVWVKRVDVVVVYRRRTSRTFPVLTISTGQLGLDNEAYVTPIIVNP